MALSDAHLRYLFAISNAAAATPDVSSRQIASALGVTKPSVVHILNILMRDGMVVKRHYGKIYLTDRGAFTVNYCWMQPLPLCRNIRSQSVQRNGAMRRWH